MVCRNKLTQKLVYSPFLQWNFNLETKKISILKDPYVSDIIDDTTTTLRIPF